MKLPYFFTAILLVTAIQSSSAINDAIKVKLLKSSLQDETIVRFLPNATESFDPSYDAYKLASLNPNASSLFTKIPTGNLSINALPSLYKDVHIELHLVIADTGTYTLTGTEIGAFASQMDIVLEDLNSGNFQSLRNNGSYSFYVSNKAQFNANPVNFIIHFSLPPNVISFTNPSCTNSTNGYAIITKPGSSQWSYQLIQNGDTNSINYANETDTINLNVEGQYQLVSNYYGTKNLYSQSFSLLINDKPIADFTADTTVIVNEQVFFNNLSLNSTTFNWNFTNTDSSDLENPYFSFQQAGLYHVSLKAITGNCIDTTSKLIEVLGTPLGGNSIEKNTHTLIINNYTQIEIPENSTVIDLYDMNGKHIITSNSSKNSNITSIFIPTGLPSGIYLVHISGNQEYFKKIYLAH